MMIASARTSLLEEANIVHHCPYCSTNQAKKISRGDFTLQTDPPLATFKGVELKLGPCEFRLLELVIRRGAVSWSVLEDFVPASADAGPDGVNVTLCTLRRKLVRVDPMSKHLIKSIRGWGLKLAA
jgi:DNA-binding response OmpR family regulator